jgi:hypothetical protein
MRPSLAWLAGQPAAEAGARMRALRVLKELCSAQETLV